MFYAAFTKLAIQMQRSAHLAVVRLTRLQQQGSWSTAQLSRARGGSFSDVCWDVGLIRRGAVSAGNTLYRREVCVGVLQRGGLVTASATCALVCGGLLFTIAVGAMVAADFIAIIQCSLSNKFHASSLLSKPLPQQNVLAQ